MARGVLAFPGRGVGLCFSAMRGVLKFLLVGGLFLPGCTNNPYHPDETAEATYFSSFSTPPTKLDPATDDRPFFCGKLAEATTCHRHRRFLAYQFRFECREGFKIGYRGYSIWGLSNEFV